jgi:ABC-type lipoprotein release transport system permease subunit
MLLAIVIVVGITNTMTIAVRERTREIGTLRAIGMGRGAVLFMFFIEATILGLLASGLGAIIGVAAAAGLDAAAIRIDVEAMRVVLLSDTLHLVPRAIDAVVAVVTLTAVSAAAAIWPAMRASRVSPVTAMQSVD